jgi:hypothetical protein
MKMRHRMTVAALTAIALLLSLAPQSMATTGYSVGSDLDDNLYRIELETGVKSLIGPVGFVDVEGLAFDAGGTLFGFDDSTNQLLKLDLVTGVGTAVGASGITPTDVGLDFNCQSNPFLSVDAPEPFNLNRIDVATGAGTPIGPQGVRVTGLGSDGQRLFGITGDSDNRTVVMDTVTGAATAIGPTGLELSDGGLAGAPDGTIWGVVDGTGQIFTVDKQTGAATERSNVGSAGFESLAIDSPSLCAPPTASIISGPEGPTKENAPSFSFSVGGQPVGLIAQCAVDGAFGACSLPGTHHTGALSDGPHTFTVRAINRDGVQADATRSFTVDTKPPQTIIKKMKINGDDVKFRFKSNEKGATFQCRLDRRKFKPCRSPRTYKNLADGKHRFRVRAIDAAGNRDATPAKRKLRIDD